jgi:hypothetical protein
VILDRPPTDEQDIAIRCLDRAAEVEADEAVGGPDQRQASRKAASQDASSPGRSKRIA